MPFIRDYAYSATSTAAGNITVPMPSFQQNDLLVALISADGSMSPTSTTATNWTRVGTYTANANNDSGMSVLVKYATATEADTLFTITSETANGTIISIGDVFFDGGTGQNALEALTASTTTPNFTASRQGFPALTTLGPDRLILYFLVADGTATTGVPSVLEGPCHTLIGKDGNSHSDGIGWAYKRTAGTIAANTVFGQIVGTAAHTGFLAQVAIKPPAAGAQVIPAYITQDNCKLINIGTGSAHSTVYGNTSATTANAAFTGIQLNGRPVAASGTTYTYTDQGINTFHSAIGILGITTSNTWAVNQTAHQAMTDLAGFNILLHLSPQVPISIQTTDAVTLAGANGLAVGLASTNGNAKAWHVHGSGTAFGSSRYVPVVVNTSNTTGSIGTLGSLATNSITTIGLFLSGKTVAPIWTCCSIWKLDTTVVCGGDANDPVTLPAIVERVADGKERRSVTIQGNNQAVVYQTLQLGNGGTDPLHLDLEEAAVEFPRQYNKTLKQVNYCSVDNKCGITFFPGSGDTISLKNSVFSSPNRFIWGFNTASAGTVTTTGCLVIGAGTVTLANSINLSDMTFSGCDAITAATNTLTRVIFTGSTGTTGAITITGTTEAALQTALNRFVSCSFTNNTTPTGALRIVYTGTAGPISLNLTSGSWSGNTADIRWEAPAGSNLTINITEDLANPPSTSSTTNSNTVNFSNPKTLSINNVIDGSEVRIYTDVATPVELAGVEVVGSTPTGLNNVSVVSDPDNLGRFSVKYNYQFTAITDIYVVVFNTGYQPVFQKTKLTSTNPSLLVNQIVDRNYSNP
jgi:hypothetical protein